MKKKITSIIGILFRELFNIKAYFYKLKNKNKKKVLFFSDSRGFLIGNLVSYKNGFLNSLASRLARQYSVTFDINKFSHTTYLDFIEKYDDASLDKFDYIVLILGVVDFSPRPSSSALKIRKAKLAKLGIEISGENDRFLQDAVLYEGEITDSIINSTIKKYIVNKLSPFKEKIIAVETGVVNNNWSGTYWKNRPININDCLLQERNFVSLITNDLISFSQLDPKIYTLDNIHYSRKGFDYLANEIMSKLHEKDSKKHS